MTAHAHAVSAPAPARSLALRALIAAQALVLGALVFLPVGFDKPTSLGLDFGHALAGIALYYVLLLAGVAVAVRRAKWGHLALQLAAPCALIGLVAAGVLRI
jgi:hypothetical protein